MGERNNYQQEMARLAYPDGRHMYIAIGGGLCKIGTTRNPYCRILQISAEARKAFSIDQMRIAALWIGDSDGIEAERELIRDLIEHGVFIVPNRLEWFRYHPYVIELAKRKNCRQLWDDFIQTENGRPSIVRRSYFVDLDTEDS